MPYRCVKCGEGHGPEKCKIPRKEENTEVFSITLNDGSIRTQVGQVLHCALCNEDGHTANYKNCEVYKTLKKQREEKNKKHIRTQPKRSYNVVKDSHLVPNVSYSQAAQSASKKKPQTFDPVNSGKGMSFINSECQNLFGISLNECLVRTNSFLAEYNQSASKEEKQEKLFNFFFSICLNG